jgi:hypothetical protein
MAAFTDARKAMRGVTGLDGKTLVSVTPRYLPLSIATLA